MKLSEHLKKHNLNLVHINNAFASYRSRDQSWNSDKEFFKLCYLPVDMGLPDADALGFSATVFDVIERRVPGETEDRTLIDIKLNGVQYCFTVDRVP